MRFLLIKKWHAVRLPVLSSITVTPRRYADVSVISHMLAFSDSLLAPTIHNSTLLWVGVSSQPLQSHTTLH
jgi:hypothetical protein